VIVDELNRYVGVVDICMPVITALICVVIVYPLYAPFYVSGKVVGGSR
jgi:hypothetical protein